MAVRWLDHVRADDIGSVGGKGASLGEMTDAGLPVPPGFVVTADTYRSFIEDTGIDEELFAAVDVETEDSGALAEAESRAKELILETPVPDHIEEEIMNAYADLDGTDPFVAVRSSGTAEDLPEASFAGQQETYLNVRGEKLLDRVRRAWASLFTQRAIYYREQQGFAHDAVDIAVVVQQMVDAE
ncbi:MAG: PEP/pyruvate-binding domain-containing protein, partial [Halodesulfurarchaeum sp.]